MTTLPPGTQPKFRQPRAPNPLDSAMRNLPRANVRSAADIPRDPGLVHLTNVPVFTEHETTARDGRKLRFTASELKAVAERCNRRIAEQGDYAAISIGHTPSPDSDAPQPEQIGFAGPFRLGTIGEPGQRQRYAILADFHVFKEDYAAGKVQKHPRRSPEIWLEDRYEEMFLDPIALLGSEAPRLDMGLLYSAKRSGRQVEVYSASAAAMPSASNTFIPSHAKQKNCRYTATDQLATQSVSQSGGLGMLSPEDLQQIVEALQQTDVFQYVQQKMMEEAGTNATVPPMEGPPAMGGGMEAPPMAGGMEPPAADPAMPPAAPPVAEPAAEIPPATPPPAAPPSEPKQYMGDHAQPGQQQYAADGGGEEPTGEYQTADQKKDMGGSKVDHDPIGTPKMDYAAELDSMDDDAFEDYAKSRRGRRRTSYQAEGSADGESPEKARDGIVEGVVGPGQEGNNDDTPNEATGEYQEAIPPKGAESYSRESGHTEAERQLVETQRKLDEANDQLVVERGQRTDAERYAKLSDQRQRFSFDLPTEMERCKFGRMSDDQFAEHLDCITTNFREIPVGKMLPSGSGAEKYAAESTGMNLEANKTFEQAREKGRTTEGSFSREDYSKSNSDKARAICEARVASGKDPGSYEETLEMLVAGKEPEV